MRPTQKGKESAYFSVNIHFIVRTLFLKRGNAWERLRWSKSLFKFKLFILIKWTGQYIGNSAFNMFSDTASDDMHVHYALITTTKHDLLNTNWTSIVVTLSFISVSVNLWGKSLVLCNPIIPACMRCTDSPTEGWMSLGVGGWMGRGGLLIVKKKEKVRSWERNWKERQIKREIERCGCVGLRASVSCRGLQMALRIKSKLCWCQETGSATHRVPHERGVRLA